MLCKKQEETSTSLSLTIECQLIVTLSVVEMR